MKKIISLLLLFTFGLSSCEKDDICDPNTPTTPRLVISFFDIADPATPKNVTNLKVVGVDGGDAKGIIFNEGGTDVTKYLTNANTISIPLRTDKKTTTYRFIFNAINSNPAAINTDILTFTYTPQNIYVSRACGFKTVFTLDPDNAVIRGLPDDNLWMQNINIQTRNIDNENEAHIEVLH